MENENKPGYKSTEFYLTIGAMILSAIYMSGVLVEGSPTEKVIGLVASAISALGYTVSRALVKKS
jgi:hypothetical protein